MVPTTPKNKKSTATDLKWQKWTCSKSLTKNAWYEFRFRYIKKFLPYQIHSALKYLSLLMTFYSDLTTMMMACLAPCAIILLFFFSMMNIHRKLSLFSLHINYQKNISQQYSSYLTVKNEIHKQNDIEKDVFWLVLTIFVSSLRFVCPHATVCPEQFWSLWFQDGFLGWDWW